MVISSLTRFMQQAVEALASAFVGWTGDTFWLLIAEAALTILAADFVSGLVHWTEDTFWSERTPVLGTLDRNAQYSPPSEWRRVRSK